MRIVSAVILAVVSFASPHADSPWITFSPPDGTVVVSMPSEPQVSSQLLASPRGSATTLIASAEQNGNEFILSVTTYSATAKKPVASAGLLAKMENALLESKNGTHFIETHRCDHTSEATFESEDGRNVRVRFDIEGGRVYQLMAQVPGGARDSEDVNRFFNSFKLRTASD